MAGRPQRFELRLTTQERVRLEKLIASSETASRLRQRARVILLRADGKTYADIEKELAISTPTIAKILKEIPHSSPVFIQGRNAALKPRRYFFERQATNR